MRCHGLALILVSCTGLVHAQGIITTIAGGGVFQFSGMDGPATNVPLGLIAGVATDPLGNVYATDVTNHLVVKVATNGVLTVVGAIAPGPSDIVPLAADASGNVFVAETCAIEKIDSNGVVSTFAGVGVCGYSGDGGLASLARLYNPGGMTVDAGGNVYIADAGNNRIRKVTPQGIISTVAGNGQTSFTGDGVPATSTALYGPWAVAVDPTGVLYIADTLNERIRRVDAAGVITTIAGGNGGGFSGDGGPATAATFNYPLAIALESDGALDIADENNNRVRRITPDGIIQSIAGTGVVNFTGDLGPGSLATLNNPASVAADAAGNVYIADSLNSRVRRIDPSGTITTYAGNGNYGFAGDGWGARGAVLNHPSFVLVDPSGDVYFSDSSNNRVRKIAANGILTTIAGGGAYGFAGDGGPAAQALLNQPLGIALDSAGNLYIADYGNNRVRKVDLAGTITTFAGGGEVDTGPGLGDGGPAADANLSSPSDVAFDANGNLYIAEAVEFGYAAIRRVMPNGVIDTFYSLLNGPAAAVTVDAAGAVYASIGPPISLGGPSPPPTGQLVSISPDGATASTVSSFAGTAPGKGAFDSQGNFYVSDNTSRVFLVTPAGTMTVVAGTAQAGFSVDEGPATTTQLNAPSGVALDSAGNLYIADRDNNRIRKVFLLGSSSAIFLPTLPDRRNPPKPGPARTE
jgi:sugar lactone lactonase YvrE